MPKCRKCGKQAALFVYENLLDDRRAPLAECAACAMPAMIAGDVNFATLQVKTTGDALIALLRQAVARTQKAIAANARNGGGSNVNGNAGAGAAPGQKACKMCHKPLSNPRYTYCFECKQNQPDCPCGRGKLGWSSRDNAYFDRCYQCVQDERAGAGSGAHNGGAAGAGMGAAHAPDGDIPW